VYIQVTSGLSVSDGYIKIMMSQRYKSDHF